MIARRSVCSVGGSIELDVQQSRTTWTGNGRVVVCAFWEFQASTKGPLLKDKVYLIVGRSRVISNTGQRTCKRSMFGVLKFT